MAKFDLRCVGLTAGTRRARVDASSDRGYVGEPVGVLAPTHTNGVTDKNVVTRLADSDPVIGTDQFKGILNSDMLDANGKTTGAVVAQWVDVVAPIPNVTIIRGKAETKATIDTEAELILVLYDFAAFAFDDTNYTIQAGGEANTSGLEIVDGDPPHGTLDVVVDDRAMREAVA